MPPKFWVAALSIAVEPKMSMALRRTYFAPNRFVNMFIGGPDNTDGT